MKKKKIDGNFGLFLLFLRKYSLVKVIFAWQFFTRYDSKIWPDFIQLHRKWPENCRTFISSFIIYLKTWIYLVTVHFYIYWMHYYSQLSIAFQFSSFFFSVRLYSFVGQASRTICRWFTPFSWWIQAQK